MPLIFFPILAHFWPLSTLFAQMRSLFAQWVSFAQNPAPNPCCVLCTYTPFLWWGYINIQHALPISSNHSLPDPKTPSFKNSPPRKNCPPPLWHCLLSAGGNRDVVQPFVFVTVTLKENKKNMLSTGHVSARHSWQPLACILPGETQNLCFANYTKCSSHTHDSNMDSCFLPMQPFFFLAL